MVSQHRKPRAPDAGSAGLLRGDEEELFREFHPRVLRAVVTSAGSPLTDLVEEACMLAWKQFLRYQAARDGAWRHWLITTAQGELWRIAWLERDHDSVERTVVRGSTFELLCRLQMSFAVGFTQTAPTMRHRAPPNRSIA